MDSIELRENWDAVCTLIKNYDDTDETQISAFFSRLQPQAMSEGFLMLTADNGFIKSWIERHYIPIIERALYDIYHVPFTIMIDIDIDGGMSRQESKSSLTQGSSLGIKAPYAEELLGSQEQKRYTYDSEYETPVKPPVGDEVMLGTTYKPTHPASPFIQSAQEQNSNVSRETKQTENSVSNNSSHEDMRKKLPSSALTFESFVVGDSNRMAYSMAVNVAETPGETPLNPLFIYGKSGLGKTHLMRAIQNYVCETQPEKKCVYADSAELLSDYMDAGAAHDKEKLSYRNFKNHYEEADILLIDDIQFLQGKKQTLDIVFQIFNKLIYQGKQIVLSADRAPKNIDIDERYSSRFNQGGTIDIQPPEIETKLAIVRSLINSYRNNKGAEDLEFPENIQMYIAENSSSNIRELQSAVLKVIQRMTVFNQPDISISEVRSLLENHFSGGTLKNLSVEDIQKEIESFYHVKHSDLVGKKRHKQISHPRHIAIYLCRQLLDLPYNDIGKKFNRDHSTALHSVSTVETWLRENNREVQEEIETLKQIIRDL